MDLESVWHLREFDVGTVGELCGDFSKFLCIV